MGSTKQIKRGKISLKKRKNLSRGKKHTNVHTKSTETKNRFKFKNFGEQIDSISFDKIQRFGRGKYITGSVLSKPNDDQSWFGVALADWRELNRSANFASFVQNVYGLVGSLSQLIFYKDQVVDLLEKHLSKDTGLAAAPLSALTATLVRDLGEDLSPFFDRLIVSLLTAAQKINDAYVFEVFIGSLFFFVKNMIQGVDRTVLLDRIMEVATSRKVRPQIQDFLAEFAAYVVGEYFDELVDFVLKIDEHFDICSSILAGSVSHKGKLIKDRLKLVLNVIYKSFDLCRDFIVSLIDRQGSENVWKCIALCLKEDASLYRETVMKVISFIAEYQNGRLIRNHVSFLLYSCLNEVPVTPVLQEAISKIVVFMPVMELLPLRPILKQIFSDVRGISMLIFLASECVEPLVGSVVAAERIISEYFCKKPDLALFIILQLMKNSSSSLVSQIGSKIPIEDLKSIMSKTDFDLARTALEVLSIIPYVQFDNFDQVWRSSLFSVEERIVLLNIGHRFIKDLDLDFIVNNIRDVRVLEILSQLEAAIVPVERLLSILLSSDNQRRLYVLTILLRTFPTWSLLEMCLKIEQIPWTFNCDREKVLIMQTLALGLKKIPGSQIPEVEAVIGYLFGVLLAGFLPLKKELYNVLSIVVDHHSAIARRSLEEIFKMIAVKCDGNEEKHHKTELQASHITLLLDGKVPKSSFLSDSPMISSNCISPLIHFLAFKPSTSDMIINTLLPFCEEIFITNTMKNSWFKNRLQACLPDLLTSLSGMKSAKHNDHYCKVITSILFRFLAFGDVIIQKKSLSSIFSLSLNGVSEVAMFSERLNRLLDDKELREELVSLVSEQSVLQQSVTWPSLINLLVPILYGRMISRKKSNSGRQSLENRRKLILNYVSTWNIESLSLFLRFIRPSSDELKKWIGTLTLLHTLIMKFGRVLSFELIECMISWLEHVQQLCVSDTVNRNDQDTKKLKGLIVKRLFDIYSVISENVEVVSFKERSWALVVDRVCCLDTEFTQEASCLLSLLTLWSSDVRFYHMLTPPEIWAYIAAAFAVPKVKTSILLKFIEILMVGIQNDLLTASSDIHRLIQSIDQQIILFVTDQRCPKMLIDAMVSLLLIVAEKHGNNLDQNMILSIVLSMAKLLPLKSLNEDSKTKLILLISTICPSCISESDIDFLYSIGVGLLDVLKEKGSRFALSSYISKLSLYKQSISEFAGLLSNLHALSKDRIGEYDYDLQNTAFSKLRKGSFLSDQSAVLKLMFYFCQDEEDTATRSQAFSVVSSLLGNVDRSLIDEIVYPAIKKGLGCKNEGVRVDFIGLLNELVKKYVLEMPFSCLQPLLAGDNDEANVFLNILHLQQHRRARALKRLAEFANQSENIPRSVVTDIFMPLLKHFVFSDPTSRDPTPPLIVHDATVALAALFRHLPLKTLLKKTQKFGEQIRSGVVFEKSLIRLISESYRHLPSDLPTSMSSSILSNLFGLLSGTVNRKEVFRLSIAVAISEVLCRLAASEREKYLGKLVMTLCTQLSHKLTNKRKESCNVLVEISRRLSSHLPLIMKTLKITLVGGYKPHILTFVISELLKSAQNIPDITRDIMPIVIEDMFGERAREKEMKEWTGRIDEVIAKKGPSIICCLLENISFDEIMIVLEPIRNAIANCSNDSWVDTACKAVESGIIKRVNSCNKKEISKISCLIYLLLDPLSDFYNATKGSFWKVYASKFQIISARVLLHLLKQNLLDTSICQQFLALLLESVTQKPELMSAFIKCLTIICRDHIVPEVNPSEFFSPLLLRLFEIVTRHDANDQSELVNATFKLISVLIKDCGVPLADSQVKALLAYIRSNIENDNHGTIAFNLIRAFIKRKLLLVEVYNLFDVIRVNCIRSFFDNVRQQCRSVFIEFLMSYPLGQNPLMEHISFFVANLGYEVEGGRISAATILGDLAVKLPEDIMSLVCETWIVAFAARLLNEKSEKVLVCVRKSCEKIVSRVDERIMERLCMLFKKWLESGHAALIKTAWALASVVINGATVPVTSLVQSVLMKPLESIITDSQVIPLTVLETVNSIVKKALINKEILELIIQLNSITHNEDVAFIEKRTVIMESFIERITADTSIVRPSLTVWLDWSRIWSKELRFCNEQTAEVIVKNILFLNEILSKEQYAEIISKVERVQRQISESSSYALAICKFYAGYLLRSNSKDEYIEFSDAVCVPIVKAVIRISESTSLNEDVKVMAQQVSDLLGVCIGKGRLTELKSAAFRDHTLLRRKRREEEAQLAISDPTAYAKKKSKMYPKL